MKVLHVIPSLSAAHGGATRAVLLMAAALREEGIEVDIATTDDDGTGRRLDVPSGTPVGDAGGSRWYFPKRTEFYKASPAFARWIAPNVKRYDLIHLHALFTYTTTIGARAARRARVPYVLEPIGTLNGYGFDRHRPWLKRVSFSLIEAPLLQHAAAVRFTSSLEAAEARRLGVKWNEAMIPLGLPASDFERPWKRSFGPGTPTLLFLSRLDPKKNLEELLRACASMRQGVPDLKLLVAGGGDPLYVASLHRLCDQLGLASHVEWAGQVEGDAKESLMQRAGIFVLPSYSENFGLAAAEALAAGLPCVLGEGVAISREVEAAGAGWVTGTSAADIAAVLGRIIAEAPQLESMSFAARQLAEEQYAAHRMGRRLAQLYAQILGAR